MRIEAGCEDCSGWEDIDDRTLRGLDDLLALLPELDTAAQHSRVRLLWEALDELESRRGKGTFSGTYHWFYVRERSARFDAAFVKRLNEAQWVPYEGKLRRPEFVPFASLDWRKHPFLESVIRFKLPELDVMAHRLGIEPGMIELLREAGIETEDALRQRLGLSADAVETSESSRQGDDNHTEAGLRNGTERVAPDGDVTRRPRGATATQVPQRITEARMPVHSFPTLLCILKTRRPIQMVSPMRTGWHLRSGQSNSFWNPSRGGGEPLATTPDMTYLALTSGDGRFFVK